MFFFTATKIEFYVGDVPEGTSGNLQNARYTRLGYDSLIIISDLFE